MEGPSAVATGRSAIHICYRWTIFRKPTIFRKIFTSFHRGDTTQAFSCFSLFELNYALTCVRKVPISESPCCYRNSIYVVLLVVECTTAICTSIIERPHCRWSCSMLTSISSSGTWKIRLSPPFLWIVHQFALPVAWWRITYSIIHAKIRNSILYMLIKFLNFLQSIVKHLAINHTEHLFAFGRLYTLMNSEGVYRRPSAGGGSMGRLWYEDRSGSDCMRSYKYDTSTTFRPFSITFWPVFSLLFWVQKFKLAHRTKIFFQNFDHKGTVISSENDAPTTTNSLQTWPLPSTRSSQKCHWSYLQAGRWARKRHGTKDVENWNHRAFTTGPKKLQIGRSA